MKTQVWHSGMQRYEATGRVDQGPCWCPLSLRRGGGICRSEGPRRLELPRHCRWPGLFLTNWLVMT